MVKLVYKRPARLLDVVKVDDPSHYRINNPTNVDAKAVGMAVKPFAFVVIGKVVKAVSRFKFELFEYSHLARFVGHCFFFPL